MACERASSQPPLLLIAGLGQGSWVWDDLERALPPHQGVSRYEARGTGALTGVEPLDSVEAMAGEVRAALEGPTDVLGFSMGGYVALTLALQAPDFVRSLLLVGTGAGGAGRVQRPLHVARAFAEAMGLPHEEFGRRTAPYTFAPGWAQANPVRLEEILGRRLQQPTPYATVEAHARACLDFYDRAIEVERIHTPALVVHGAEDLIVPVRNGRLLAARLPNAQYVELPGRGHNLMLEDPQVLTRLVNDFLATLA